MRFCYLTTGYFEMPNFYNLNGLGSIPPNNFGPQQACINCQQPFPLNYPPDSVNFSRPQPQSFSMQIFSQVIALCQSIQMLLGAMLQNLPLSGNNFANPMQNPASIGSSGGEGNIQTMPTGSKTFSQGSMQQKIVDAATKKGVPPAIALAMFEKESDFNPNAVGDGGRAVGIGQLHAAAAREGGISPAERNDPDKAIDASLNYLLARYKETNDWTKALATYNQGPKNFNANGSNYAADVMQRAKKFAA